MNPEDIERRLSDAFTSQAYEAVGDHTPVPALNLDRPAERSKRPVTRILAPLATAAAIAAVAVGIAAHQNNNNTAGRPATGRGTSPTLSSSIVPLARQIAVKVMAPTTATVGVGMPVVAYFSQAVADGRSLQRATKVEVDGKPVEADWYFTPSTLAGYRLEGHLRMQNYWPAHAKIAVSVPVTGLSAGNGLVYADGFSLRFATGAATIAQVFDAKHQIAITEDGKFFGSFPVSLGASSTPTLKGVKVIMQKGESVCMSGPSYHECGVKYTQRLTTSGEYLLAAPWNTSNIKTGIDSSNGCTNLTTADAARLYSILEVGDVVEYPDASGSTMNVSDGIGDWNVPWKTWLTGGLVPTH